MPAEQHFTYRFASVFLQHKRAPLSWTKQFTGTELSTDLQSSRIVSDDLTPTVCASVVCNYNKSTLNRTSLNYTSYLHHSLRQPCHCCTPVAYSAPVFPRFNLLISESKAPFVMSSSLSHLYFSR